MIHPKGDDLFEELMLILLGKFREINHNGINGEGVVESKVTTKAANNQQSTEE